MLRLIWKNAWRSKRRTALTVLSLCASLFLFSSMMCVLSSSRVGLERASKSSRLVVRNAAGLTHNLPYSYKEKLQQIPHVKLVHESNWFGGMIPRKENVFFANFAVDLESTEATWDEYRFEPGVIDKWRTEKRGAVVSRLLMERMMREDDWKVGKTITLHSPIYSLDLEFILLGMCEGPDQSIMFFRYDYLDEARRARGQKSAVGTYWLKVDDAASIPSVSHDVDALFANSECETKTETEKAFLEGFNTMMGNIRDLVVNISLAIVVMLLMVTVNTMAMSARERTNEHAVMQCLGFGRGWIAALFVGESLVISLLGALFGVGGAWLLYRPSVLDFRAYWPDFFMTPANVAIGFGVALLVGLLAGALPGIASARRSIVDGLRRVD